MRTIVEITDTQITVTLRPRDEDLEVRLTRALERTDGGVSLDMQLGWLCKEATRLRRHLQQIEE